MAKVCLLIVALVGCAPVVAHAPEPSLAQAPTEPESSGVRAGRARVARLAPPFAARVAARRVSDTTNASDAAMAAQPLAELTRH